MVHRVSKMEHEVALVIGKNGSSEVIAQDIENNNWVEITVLGFLLIVSTTLNLSIACAVALGQAINTIDVPSVLIGLSVVNAIDGMLSQSLALLFLSIWPTSGLESPPFAICRLSAVVYFTTLIVPPLYLLVIIFHIFFRRQHHRGDLLSRLSIGIPPLTAVALSCPMLLPSNLVCAHHFINRYACSITGENLPYSVILVTIGFLLPWATLAYCILVKNCSCNGGGNSQLCFWASRDRRYTCSLATLAAILVLPSTTSFCVSSMTEPKNSRTYMVYSNGSISRTLIVTGPLDTVLVWGRFIYNSLSPMVTLIFLKDLQQEWRRMMASLLFCSMIKANPDTNHRKSKNTMSGGSPVLCATGKGLFLIHFDKNGSRHEVCDLVEDEKRISRPSTSTVKDQSVASHSSTSFNRKKQTDKKKPLKVVRFAQYVKEIPP